MMDAHNLQLVQHMQGKQAGPWRSSIIKQSRIGQVTQRVKVCLTPLLQGKQAGFATWSNIVLDGKGLRAAGQSPAGEVFDVAAKQWDTALPAKGKLQLDVLLLPEAACPWLDDDGNLAVGLQPTTRDSAGMQHATRSPGQPAALLSNAAGPPEGGLLQTGADAPMAAGYVSVIDTQTSRDPLQSEGSTDADSHTTHVMHPDPQFP